MRVEVILISVVVLIVILLIAARIATSVAVNDTVIDKYRSDIVNDLEYFKDPATGLCFASIKSRSADFYTIRSITNVPCDAVAERVR